MSGRGKIVRGARRLLICVLLGALLTVLIAWGLSLRFQRRPPGASMEAAMEKWPVAVPSHWIPSPAACGIRRGAGVAQRDFGILFIRDLREDAESPIAIDGAPQGAHSSIHTVRLTIIDAGWPLVALRHERFGEQVQFLGVGVDSGRTATVQGHPTSPLRLGWPAGTHRLGVNPLWRGFLVNTGLFAGAMFASRTGFLAARERSRRRRGACTACGYDLTRGGDRGLCPECGNRCS